MWQYRDLTYGDTSAYFVNAYRWFESVSVEFPWSPLYTSFYGSLLFLSENVYAVTILHRLIIIFTVTLMVFLLMRKLLPHPLAWLLSVWWAILPINFDTLYEVHLFSAISLLAAWLLILYIPNMWGRGGALAVLSGAAVLVRNEFIIVAAILACMCIIREIRSRKRFATRRKVSTYVVSYGLPLLLAGLLCFFFYTRSFIKFPQLWHYSEKHTVNMCQVYAFSYQQRYPDEWKKNPWTECYDLMEVQFGKRLLSLPEMILSNPAAVVEHILWNFRLLPSGIQVSLFNEAAGSFNPDYAPITLNSTTAYSLSIISCVIVLLGGGMLYRERQYWWRCWLRERGFAWGAMLAVVIMIVFLVVPTQRPRPSYMFGLSLFLMAGIGMCLFVLTHRWSVLKRLTTWMPMLMFAILSIVPCYYSLPENRPPQRLLQTYRRLMPFQEIIADRSTVFFKGEYAGEIRNFVGHGFPKTFPYSILSENLSSVGSLIPFLETRNMTLLYIDEILLARLSGADFEQTFLELLQLTQWKVLAFQNSLDNRWMLLQKVGH